MIRTVKGEAAAPKAITDLYSYNITHQKMANGIREFVWGT